MTTAAPPKFEKAPVEKTAAAHAQAKAPRVRKWLTFAGRVIVWQIVAILFAEFTLSLAGLGEEEIYKLHPKYGFVHMSNKRVTWRSEGYSKSYFGPDGMREANLTIQKPAGVFRVALLGDSIVESLQVPLEETFGQKLEKQLKKSADGKELQILNFGNSGYSTAQEYLQLKDKVLKYNPDAVIVFYNHRDLFENWSPPDQTITNVATAHGRQFVGQTMDEFAPRQISQVYRMDKRKQPHLGIDFGLGNAGKLPRSRL
jgi:hypothetical protein